MFPSFCKLTGRRLRAHSSPSTACVWFACELAVWLNPSESQCPKGPITALVGPVAPVAPLSAHCPVPACVCCPH
jgi:hypothetical protein